MALFRKDNNVSRAVGIIKDIKPNKENVTEETQVETQAQAEEKVETPEVQETQTQQSETEAAEATETPVDTQDKKPVEEQPPAQPEVPETTDIIKEPVEPTTPEITEEMMFNYLSETLKRPIKTLDDLTIREQQELDPEVQQIVEWKEKTGLSLSRFSEYNRDFSKMSDLEVAREILSQDYPNLDTDELNYVLRDYIYNEDVDDEADKMKKSIALKKLASDGRKTLEKNRLNLVPSETGQVLTKEQQDELAFAQQVRESQKTAQANQTQYQQNIEKAALSLKSVNMQLSDDVNIQYDVPEADKKTLPKMVQEMPHWYNEDGSMNHEAIVRDAFIIREHPNMVKKAFEQGISVGMEGKIKKDKNLTIDPGFKAQQNQVGEKKGNIEQVVSNIAGGPTRRSKLRFGKSKES